MTNRKPQITPTQRRLAQAVKEPAQALPDASFLRKVATGPNQIDGVTYPAVIPVKEDDWCLLAREGAGWTILGPIGAVMGAENIASDLSWHTNVSGAGFRVTRLGALWFAMGYVSVTSGISGSAVLVSGIPSGKRPSTDSVTVYFPDNTAVSPFRLGSWGDGSIEVRAGTSVGNGYFLAFGF